MDAFLEELRSEGRPDSEGRFTLDWKRANSILARHLLSEREDCVLKVIQLAVRAGATYVRAERVPGGLRLYFDRPQLTMKDLENLPAALLNPRDPLRDLALAVHSALHADWPVFNITTPEGTMAGNRERFEAQGFPLPGPQYVGFGSISGLSWDMVARRCPHPPLALSPPCARDYAAPVAELRHEGRRRHLWLPPSSAKLVLRLPPEDDYPEMSVGLEREEGPAHIWLSVAGVCRPHVLPWKTPGVVALASADHLTTDLSGLRVVEDEAYRDLLADLGRETERLVREVRARLPGLPYRERLQALRMKLM